MDRRCALRCFPSRVVAAIFDSRDTFILERGPYDFARHIAVSHGVEKRLAPVQLRGHQKIPQDVAVNDI